MDLSLNKAVVMTGHNETLRSITEHFYGHCTGRALQQKMLAIVHDNVNDIDMNNPFYGVHVSRVNSTLADAVIPAHSAISLPINLDTGELVPCTVDKHAPHHAITHHINSRTHVQKRKIAMLVDRGIYLKKLVAMMKIHEHWVTAAGIGLVMSEQTAEYFKEECKGLYDSFATLDRHLIAYASAPGNLKGEVKAAFKADYLEANAKYEHLLNRIISKSMKAGEKSVLVSTRQMLKIGKANPSFSLLGLDEVRTVARYSRFAQIAGPATAVLELALDVPEVLKDRSEGRAWKKEAGEDVGHVLAEGFGGWLGESIATAVLASASLGWICILAGISGALIFGGVSNVLEDKSFFG